MVSESWLLEAFADEFNLCGIVEELASRSWVFPALLTRQST